MDRKMSGYCFTVHCSSTLLYIKVLTSDMLTSAACLVLVSLLLFIMCQLMASRFHCIVLHSTC